MDEKAFQELQGYRDRLAAARELLEPWLGQPNPNLVEAIAAFAQAQIDKAVEEQREKLQKLIIADLLSLKITPPISSMTLVRDAAIQSVKRVCARAGKEQGDG